MTMLIAIEGIDGSGKGTQTKLLCERLAAEGISVARLAFPRYEATGFGKRVAEFLNGAYGALDVVDPFLVAGLYAGDRFESRDLIARMMAENQIVLCDRYVSSNLAYQLAKVDPARRVTLKGWIEQLEYEIYSLPKADLTIYLELDAETSQALVLKKDVREYTAHSLDLHEAAQGYLGHVRLEYLRLAGEESGWTVVTCSEGTRLRTIEEIGEEVYRVVMGAVRG
ncbi:dTMP kinase [Lacunimicrobium album]